MGLGYQPQGFALINALVLAKVMLVAEDLKLDRGMRAQPIAVAALAEAFLFAIVFIVFHVLESLVVGLLHGSTLAGSIPAFGGRRLCGPGDRRGHHVRRAHPLFRVSRYRQSTRTGRVAQVVVLTPGPRRHVAAHAGGAVGILAGDGPQILISTHDCRRNVAGAYVRFGDDPSRSWSGCNGRISVARAGIR